MAIAEREVAPQTSRRLYTEDEYLALEEKAEEKSEYVDGEIRLMPGGTDYHGALAINLGAELRAALRGRGCLVMSSDVKVRAARQMYYPDLSVTCGPRQFFSGHRTVITNPLLVAEVASPSTESKDRGEKFRNYIAIESLVAYLLVSQNEARAELFSRGEHGNWDYTVAEGLESTLAVPALGISLTLADVYAEIDFAEAAEEE